MRSGLLRLWVVTTAVWLGGWAIKVSVDRWSNPACFQVFTVSIAENASITDKDLAEGLQRKMPASTYCGEKADTDLFTLESLAKRQVVTQVAIRWLTPFGWSDHEFGSIDVFGKFGDVKLDAITITNIRRSTLHLVRQSRLKALFDFLPIIIGLPFIILAIGAALVWVMKGFNRTGGHRESI